jgi:hypothetical protein
MILKRTHANATSMARNSRHTITITTMRLLFIACASTFPTTGTVVVVGVVGVVDASVVVDAAGVDAGVLDTLDIYYILYLT